MLPTSCVSRSSRQMAATFLRSVGNGGIFSQNSLHQKREISASGTLAESTLMQTAVPN